MSFSGQLSRSRLFSSPSFVKCSLCLLSDLPSLLHFRSRGRSCPQALCVGFAPKQTKRSSKWRQHKRKRIATHRVTYSKSTQNVRLYFFWVKSLYSVPSRMHLISTPIHYPKLNENIAYVNIFFVPSQSSLAEENISAASTNILAHKYTFSLILWHSHINLLHAQNISTIFENYHFTLFGGTRGVMVIVVGNGHGDTSSNPGQDWLHFT